MQQLFMSAKIIKAQHMRGNCIQWLKVRFNKRLVWVSKCYSYHNVSEVTEDRFVPDGIAQPQLLHSFISVWSQSRLWSRNLRSRVIKFQQFDFISAVIGFRGLLATRKLPPTHFLLLAWIIKWQRIEPGSIFISGSAIFCFHLQIMRLRSVSGTQRRRTPQTPFRPWPRKFYQLVS